MCWRRGGGGFLGPRGCIQETIIVWVKMWKTRLVHGWVQVSRNNTTFSPYCLPKSMRDSTGLWFGICRVSRNSPWIARGSRSAALVLALWRLFELFKRTERRLLYCLSSFIVDILSCCCGVAVTSYLPTSTVLLAGVEPASHVDVLGGDARFLRSETDRIWRCLDCLNLIPTLGRSGVVVT